jgi:hypothetical protein
MMRLDLVTHCRAPLFIAERFRTSSITSRPAPTSTRGAFSRHGKVSRDIWESDLFRLASLTWAVPVSNGFGRTLRYLVWDEHNDKLIGLIAIGDPSP